MLNFGGEKTQHNDYFGVDLSRSTDEKTRRAVRWTMNILCEIKADSLLKRRFNNSNIGNVIYMDIIMRLINANFKQINTLK